MARMAHACARAALIHQHATRERDAIIAAALSDLIGTRAQPGGDTRRVDAMPTTEAALHA
jgi:hypothetical protein